MFNASIDGLALWNAAGEIVDANPALWRMYGYSDDEFSAIAAGTLRRPVVPPGVPAIGGDAASRLHAEFTELRKDGSAAGARGARRSRCSTRASRTC